jgi:NTE family protein
LLAGTQVSALSDVHPSLRLPWWARWRRIGTEVATAFVVAVSGTAVAQDTAPAADVAAPARPRIALVLSGGGARGFAHVGVLRALHDMRVPVDFVTGASMGAVVGGAYASGRSVDELEQFVRQTDWAQVLADRSPRDDLAFRRREDDLILPSRLEFGLDRAGLHLPPGAVGNATLEATLIRLLPPGSGDQPLDRLPLPFRCIAADLLTGEMVTLHDSPLFASLRASLAMPGVFEPIRIKGRLLVDGGLVRNLPVDTARQMGADVVIAVNVGTPLSAEDELASAVGVARQMLHILTEQNVQRSLGELAPADVLIAPDLTGISFMNFGQAERAMAAGRRTAEALAVRLAAFAVSPEDYAAFDLDRRRAGAVPEQPRTITRLQVHPSPNAGSAALAARLGLATGQTLGSLQIHEAAARLLAGGEFERVEVDIRDGEDTREVHVTPVEAPWARSRLRLGLEANSDFADDHRFTVSALHVMLWLNEWGGEWRTLARVGSERSIATQLWQPLAPGAPWYVGPSLTLSSSSLDAYEGGQRTQRVAFDVAALTLTVGRQLGNWGNVQLGIDRRVGRGRTLFGRAEDRATVRLAETAPHLQLQVDTLDSLALPSRGWLLQGRVERTLGSASLDGESRASASGIGLFAFRAGEWASHLYAEWARSHSGLAPLSLGGFLRLSGTPRDSVGAREVVLGRLVMAHRIGEMPAGLGGALRAGFSLELGAGHDTDASLRMRDLQQAGSAFISIDTRFGPLFIAAGATRGGGSALYLFLGPFW